VVAESSSEIVYIPYAEAYARGFEDMLRRVPDTSRIEALLDWHPQIPLDQILVRVQDDLQAGKGHRLGDSA
jgi:UDP-glucose 4-epimerase